LLLVNIDHSNILKIFGDVKNEKVCFKSIPIFFKDELETRKIIETLEEKLKNSNSIQDHYVLLLYWLLRRNGIRDFSYKNVERLGKSKPYSQNEVLIDKNVDPQKQHIIPFSKLRDVLGEEDLKRTSKHPANNIGNITYISKNLNNYETGLGDEFINLEDEPKENKLAHFLEGEEIENQYKYLIDQFSKSEDSKNKGKLKDEYEKFCSLRRKEIIKGFGEWLNELDKLVFQDLNISSFENLTDESIKIVATDPMLEDTNKKGKKTDEKEFFNELQKNKNEKIISAFREIYEKFKSENRIEWGQGGFKPIFYLNDKKVNDLFRFHSNAILQVNFGKMKKFSIENVSIKIKEWFENRGIKFTSNNIPKIDFEKILPHFDSFKELLFELSQYK